MKDNSLDLWHLVR